MLSQMLITNEVLASNEVGGIESGDELIEKCGKSSKIRKLSESLKLSKSQKLAKSKKKLLKRWSLTAYG